MVALIVSLAGRSQRGGRLASIPEIGGLSMASLPSTAGAAVPAANASRGSCNAHDPVRPALKPSPAAPGPPPAPATRTAAPAGSGPPPAGSARTAARSADRARTCRPRTDGTPAHTAATARLGAISMLEGVALLDHALEEQAPAAAAAAREES